MCAIKPAKALSNQIELHIQFTCNDIVATERKTCHLLPFH